MPVGISKREFKRSILLPYILVGLLCGAIACQLPPIGGSSEAREAHVIRLMVEQDNYILPSRNGLVPSKPPLYHWIGVAIGRAGLGFSPFAARLPSLLAGTLMLVLLLHSARLLSSHLDYHRQGLLIGLAGFALSSSYAFERMRTVAMVDMVFAGLVTAAIVSLVRRLWDRSLRDFAANRVIREQDKILFFLSSGLAILAKGPVGLPFIGLMIAPLLLSRLGLRGTMMFFLTPSLGWPIFVAIILPWYYLAATNAGEAFLGRQIIFENLQRFTGGENVNAQPWWFYLPAFIRSALPWSVLFAFGAADVFIERRARDAPTALASSVIRALTLAVILCLVFLSLAEGKRESYLLPLSPWVALVAAYRGEQLFAKFSPLVQEKIGRCLRQFLILILIGMIAITIAIEAVSHFGISSLGAFGDVIVPWLVADRFSIALAGTLALLLFAVTRMIELAPYQRLVAYGLSFWIVMSFLIAEGYSIRNRFKDFERVSLEIRRQVNDEPLQVVRERSDEFFDGILYYLGRPVTLVSPDQFPLKCKGFALVRFDQWQELKRQGGLAQAVEVAVYAEIDDRIRGHSSNQKLLVRCR